MNLTLAITTYNRHEMLLESFANVVDDKRIDEIIIMDDHSEDKYWNKIKDLGAFNHKIKVTRQLFNRGMSENKRDAIACSKNQWVIIFDSDNIIRPDYLDAIELRTARHNGEMFLNNIYCPSFAKPHFDYRKYENKNYSAIEVVKVLSEPEFSCLINTCNYVVHRDSYLSVWQENKEMKASDTIWFNYLWLKAGKSFFVVPGMHYYHRVHKDSGFIQDCDFNMKKAEEIKKLIRQL